MEDKVATSFSINKELHRNLKIAAVVKGVTISDLMENALMEYIDTLEMHKWIHVDSDHPRG